TKKKLPTSIKTGIVKHLKCPIELIDSCKDWHDIAKNGDPKAE
ncbi:8515_t:CDS:1, partial [Racocetra persica]